jgi:hypothetical protein
MVTCFVLKCHLKSFLTKIVWNSKTLGLFLKNAISWRKVIKILHVSSILSSLVAGRMCLIPRSRKWCCQIIDQCLFPCHVWCLCFLQSAIHLHCCYFSFFEYMQIAGVVVVLHYTLMSEEIATFKDWYFDWKEWTRLGNLCAFMMWEGWRLQNSWLW